MRCIRLHSKYFDVWFYTHTHSTFVNAKKNEPCGQKPHLHFSDFSYYYFNTLLWNSGSKNSTLQTGHLTNHSVLDLFDVFSSLFPLVVWVQCDSVNRQSERERKKRITLLHWFVPPKIWEPCNYTMIPAFGGWLADDG